jgi:outer membrane protein, heavy metal efflux system
VKSILRLSASALLSLIVFRMDAQQSEKKAYVLRGSIEAVNAAAKQLTVHSEPVPGWMGEMTMGFGVDDPGVLNRVKPGDRITAKVYEGDFTLHDVQVLPAEKPAESSSGGAPKPGLRLEELERMAIGNNPTMAQAQANLRVAAGLVRQAGLYPNPTAGYYGDEIRGGYIGGGKQGGFVSQTIVLGGKLGAARRVAQVAANEIDTTGQAQRLRIRNNVRALFYQVLGAQRLVEVRQNLAGLAADATETSRQLGNIGQADRPDILQAEVEQQQASVSLRIARLNLQSWWRILAAVVGKPDLPVSALEGDMEAIPDLKYEEQVAMALRESPEISRAQQAVERAEASLSQARRAPIPDLQVTGILAENYAPLETTGRPSGLMGGAQIGIQLPIFNRNQGNIAASRAEIESTKQQLTRVRLQLQRDLAGIFRDYNSARITVEQYKTEMLPRAEEAYKLYQTNYRKMSGAYPQALISQRTLFQLEADYVQALENAWQSALAIQGFGLMDGLAEPALTGRGSPAGSASGTYGVNGR